METTYSVIIGSDTSRIVHTIQFGGHKDQARLFMHYASNALVDHHLLFNVRENATTVDEAIKLIENFDQNSKSTQN
jgi:hypothetical protein